MSVLVLCSALKIDKKVKSRQNGNVFNYLTGRDQISILDSYTYKMINYSLKIV